MRYGILGSMQLQVRLQAEVLFPRCGIGAKRPSKGDFEFKLGSADNLRGGVLRSSKQNVFSAGQSEKLSVIGETGTKTYECTLIFSPFLLSALHNGHRLNSFILHHG